MSLIGKRPIKVESGVEVKISGNNITLKGPKGELFYNFLPLVTVSQVENEIIVKRNEDTKEGRSVHGLTRALINNMMIGVSKGFEKRLEIVGVGYRAQVSGKKIILNLGFSHPIEQVIPDDLKVEMDKDNKNIIIVSGIDKQKVGELSAQIRKYRPPEPYKGKGVKYVDEYIHRKAGKAAKSA